jgi:glycerol-3-phosphate dehydrogenase
VHYSWSGVRTLLEEEKNNPAHISREYKIELNTSEQNTLPLVNIFGGKLTTHRCMAEKIVNLLKPFFPTMGPAWTELSPLPGSDFNEGNKKTFLHHLHHEYPHLPRSLLARYVRQYGTHTTRLLDKAQSVADLGEHFGHDLYEKEIAYLIDHEWAATGEDILWRRTKLGLFLTPQEQAAVNDAVNKMVLSQKLVS